MIKKRSRVESVYPKLSEAEQDLVQHLEQGYELETDSLGSNPILRGRRDDEVLRPSERLKNAVSSCKERVRIR